MGEESTYHKDSDCRICERHCRVRLSVSSIGLVISSGRIVPMQHGFELMSCNQLSQAHGLNLNNALTFINRPPLPRFLAGGH
jgi:hypothetical protein